MRINSKSIITLLIAFLMIFGTAFYSYAAANTDKVSNTQIHLKTGSYSQLESLGIICYIKGHYGSAAQNIVLEGINVTALPMTTKGGSGQFVTQDLNLSADPEILYFTIGGIKYYIGQQIMRIGKEGGGTINYEVKSLPKYTLTYDGNGSTGGTVPAPATQYQADTNIVVLGNIGNFVKTNHTFTGWRTTPDASGTAYAASSTLKMPFADVTLYAQWLENPKYTVTYMDGGADEATKVVPVDPNKYYSGENVTVLPQGSSLKKDGFDFVGWQYNGIVYAPDAVVLMGTDNIVFTAIWKAINTPVEKFKVTYNTNTTPVETYNHIVGDSNEILGDTIINLFNLPSDFTLPKHKTFKGWSTDPAGSVQYAVGDPFKVLSNATFYAVWENDPTYKVIYDGNGNTGGTAPTDETQYYPEDIAKVKAIDPNFNKSNYNFLGWSSNQAATTQDYIEGSEITFVDHDVYLFAVWQKNPPTFKVDYNANGGSGDVPVDEQLYYSNDSATVLNGENLTKKDHKIVGWKVGNEGNVYKSGDKLTISGDVTLFAVWEFVPPQESNPPSTNPPGETNPPSTNPPGETNPPTTESTTVATTEATLEEVEIEEELGAPAGAASSTVETTDELVELDEPVVPLGDALPQTGQLPVELFYGVGGLITAAGIYLKRKSS